MTQPDLSPQPPEQQVDPLLTLATARFGQLTGAELKLLEAASTGEMRDCRSANEDENDPGEASSWEKDRTIRSSIIRWLCSSRDALPLISSAGIAVAHARLTEELNLVGVSVSFSLSLFNCAVPDGINMQNASLRNLNLGGTVCGHLNAERLTVTGSLFLRFGFCANGPVNLVGASIAGDLECVQGVFGGVKSASPPPATKFKLAPNIVLILDRANIGGRLFFSEMDVQGIVYLAAATINGPLECVSANITIGINLRDARTRSINFSGTKCPFFIADRLEVKGSLFLRNSFRSIGTVVLFNSSISGDLDCTGSYFGSAELDPELRAKAEASFGTLPSAAFNLNSSSIGGYAVFGEGFVAQGEVDADDLDVGANLICSGGQFLNAGKTAFSCQFARVRGAALFRKGWISGRPFQTNGQLNFFGSNIAGSISFTGAEFLASASTGLKLQNGHVSGALQWKNVNLAPGTELNLSHLTVGQFEDDDSSWPVAGKLILDGFSYDAIGGVPLDSRRRKAWLRSHLAYLKRQFKNEFTLQPHRQLADTLRKSGYEDNARDVLIDMHKARREQGGFSRFGWLWSWILQYTIGFGYRSHRAFLWGLFFVLMGAFLFNAAYRAGHLANPKPEAKITKFSAIGYSLDTFLPIINLHQEELWVPSGTDRGRWVQYYYWIHICLGWALITLGVAGFTGLIRRE